MRKISLILVLSLILSLIYIPAVSAVDVDDYIYYNEFNSALSSEDELTLRPVNNGQDSIIVSTDDSSLMFRGDGSKTWTGSTYYAKLDLGTVENKPKLVYETKFKAEKYGSYTNIASEQETQKTAIHSCFI